MGGRGGDGGGRTTCARGSDLRYNLEISLEEAFAGKQQKIQFTTATTCDACSGTGSKDGSKHQPVELVEE